LLSKVSVPDSAKRKKRKDVLFETESIEKRKKKEDWLYSDEHEELLRSRDEHYPFIYEEHEYHEILASMDKYAKQMLATDWDDAYDSDTMDDEDLIKLLLIPLRRIQIEDE